MNRPEANSVIVLDNVVTFAFGLTAANTSFAVSPGAQTASQSPHCSPRLFVVFQIFSCLFTVLGFFSEADVSRLLVLWNISCSVMWAQAIKLIERLGECKTQGIKKNSFSRGNKHCQSDFKVHLVFFTGWSTLELSGYCLGRWLVIGVWIRIKDTGKVAAELFAGVCPVPLSIQETAL